MPLTRLADHMRSDHLSRTPTPVGRPTLLGLLLMALGAVGVAGQLPDVEPLAGATSQADALYEAGYPKEAFDRLSAHLATDSTDYGALWRAARSAVVLGIDQEHHLDQNAWLDPALELARRAVVVQPDGLDGIYWRGVAAGRRAMNAGPGYAVELAEAVYEDAHAILAADSLHGGAHNMLGKLNYEVMSLSRFKRLIARTFMGGEALDDTSWEQAEYHLGRAAELWPDFVLFHFDLGQLYRKRDRRDEAVREFVHALSLPAVHPTDKGLHRQAREILQEWGIDPTDVVTSLSEGHAGSTTAR